MSPWWEGGRTLSSLVWRGQTWPMKAHPRTHMRAHAHTHTNTITHSHWPLFLQDALLTGIGSFILNICKRTQTNQSSDLARELLYGYY